MNYTKQLE
jgi:hypothetical protein